MEKTLDIITIGECLLELSTNEYFERASSFNLSFGGDVIASAVAAKRLGSKVGIITSIGDDYFKNTIIKRCFSCYFNLYFFKHFYRISICI